MLERNRQYRAVLALYKLMDRYGYEFYENPVLNAIFKRLISAGTVGLDVEFGSDLLRFTKLFSQ